MIRNFRRRAVAVAYVGCAGLAACTDQAPTAARQPAVIYVHPPKAPQGLAGVGGFSLTPDGKVAVNGSNPDTAGGRTNRSKTPAVGRRRRIRHSQPSSRAAARCAPASCAARHASRARGGPVTGRSRSWDCAASRGLPRREPSPLASQCAVGALLG